MTESEEPFDDLYADAKPYDRERLATVLSEFLQVDRQTGEPVRQPRFSDLSPAEQAIALMLYRRVAHELGELDTPVKTRAIWFADHSEIKEVDVLKLPSSFKFVEETDDHDYHIPEHLISDALSYFEYEV